MSAKGGPLALGDEVEKFVSALRASCTSRTVEPRELQLIKAELAERDERIRSLERTLEEREAARVLMCAADMRMSARLSFRALCCGSCVARFALCIGSVYSVMLCG